MLRASFVLMCIVVTIAVTGGETRPVEMAESPPAEPAASPPAEPTDRLVRLYAGSYDTDAFLREPLIERELVALLGAELEHFRANLDVRGSVDLSGGTLALPGNAVHGGTEEEAIVCVYGTSVTAAIFSSGAVAVYSRDSSYDNQPLCIKDWITLVQSLHRARFQQPERVRVVTPAG